MKDKKTNTAQNLADQIIVPLENVKDGINALYAVLTAMQDISHEPREFIPALRFVCQNTEADIDIAVKLVCESMQFRKR